MKREYLLIASQTLRTPLLLHAVAIRVARPSQVRLRQGYGGRVSVNRCSGAGLKRVGLLGERLSSDLSNVDHLLQDLLDGAAQVLHQVKANGNLDGIGRPLPRTFGKRASPVTRDDLHTGVILQPGRQGRGTGVGKQLKRSIGAKV